MARLPNPGGDAGQWGEILNEFLSQSISADGSLNISTVGAPQLRPGAVTSTAIANGAVTTAKIADGAVGQHQLADDSVSAAKLQDAGQANGPVVLDGDGLVPAGAVPMQAVADSDEVKAAAEPVIEATIRDRSVIRASSGDVASIPAYGLRPVRLGKFRRALRAAESGSGRCRILLVGDSTTMGVGAPAKVGSYPWQLTSLLASYLAPTAYTLGIPQQAGSNDQRWNVGANPRWSFLLDSLAVGFGGLSYYRSSSSSGSGPLTYTPGMMADTFVIFYAIFSGGPTAIPVSIGGVAQSPINAQSGVSGTIGRAVFNVPRSSNHAVVFGTPTGGDLKGTIFAVESYDSTAPGIEVMNAGVGSATSAGWTATNIAAGQNGAAMIRAIAPDLTLFMLGINDDRSGLGVNYTQTNLATLASSAKASGDAIFMTAVPAHTNQPGAGTQSARAGAVRSLADSEGIPLIDIMARQISYIENSTAGFAADPIGHLNQSGYGDIARAVFDALREAA